MKKPKLNVICLTSSTMDEINTYWDFYFILNDLLLEFDVNLIVNDNPSEILENPLIVYSCDSKNISDRLRRYLQLYIDAGHKFNLYHISNESLNHDCGYYDYAKVVFRSYYDPNINKPNVHFLPLGYKSGFRTTNGKPLKYSEKKYDINFIGQLKSDRHYLLNQINKINNSFIHITSGWNSQDSLSTSKMCEIYQQTLLIPCPMGNIHPDSFRICEALESGSIPVIKKYMNYDYFDLIYGENPIPKINDWDELPKLIDSIKINPDDKINEINEWYLQYKIKLRNKILNLLT